jgi:capsular polysaccharide biosynthesis protein
MSMTLASYSFEDLDAYLRNLRGKVRAGQRVAIRDGLDFHCVDLSRPGQIPRLKAEASREYREAFSAWVNFRNAFEQWPIGYFVARDVTCMGPTGAVLDHQRGTLLIGHSIGWTEDYAEFYLRGQGSFDRLGTNQFTFKAEAEAVSDEVDDAVVVSGPGYEVFGHHLLDYMPRNWMIETLGLAKDRIVMRQRMSTWATQLTLPLRDTSADRILDRNDHVRARNLVVTTVPKYAAWIDCNYGFEPIRIVRDHYAATSSVKIDKLCVSRSKWAANARIEGSLKWDAHFIGQGFNVVHPQDWDVATQIAVFRGARQFAGLDGSGLHTALFSEAPEKMIVVHGERCNHFHFTVASLFPEMAIELIDARDHA